MAAKKHNNLKLQSMVYPCQNYERIFANATFTFFGAFSTIEDFVMKEEVELLHRICEAEGFEWFKTGIKMSKPRVRLLFNKNSPNSLKKSQNLTKILNLYQVNLHYPTQN